MDKSVEDTDTYRYSSFTEKKQLLEEEKRLLEEELAKERELRVLTQEHHAQEVQTNVELTRALGRERSQWKSVFIGLTASALGLSVFCAIMLSPASPNQTGGMCCERESSAAASSGSGGGSGAEPNIDPEGEEGKTWDGEMFCDREPREPFPEIHGLISPSYLRTSIYTIMPRKSIQDTESSKIPFIRI